MRLDKVRISNYEITKKDQYILWTKTISFIAHSLNTETLRDQQILRSSILELLSLVISN